MNVKGQYQRQLKTGEHSWLTTGKFLSRACTSPLCLLVIDCRVLAAAFEATAIKLLNQVNHKRRILWKVLRIENNVPLSMRTCGRKLIK